MFLSRRQMLDREGKREKILEGKLREIKIKLKKQQEQQEARASDLLARQAEKAVEEIKAQEEEPQVKPSTSQGKQIVITLSHFRLFQCLLSLLVKSPVMIESAETEFYQMVEEEIQHRIKEQETQEEHDKKKSPKVHKMNNENGEVHDSETEDPRDEDLLAVNGNGTHSNGSANGHHHENGHNENGNDVELEA